MELEEYVNPTNVPVDKHFIKNNTNLFVHSQNQNNAICQFSDNTYKSLNLMNLLKTYFLFFNIQIEMHPVRMLASPLDDPNLIFIHSINHKIQFIMQHLKYQKHQSFHFTFLPFTHTPLFSTPSLFR